MNFHTPVLSNEVLEYLDPKPGEIVFDGTLGGGGHSLELAKKIGKNGFLIATDLDPAAITAAEIKFREAKVEAKVSFEHANYKDIQKVLAKHNVEQVNKILIDIGVSSYDFDSSLRGFSFQKEEQLDMRFNPEERPDYKKHEPFNAKYILNHYQEHDLRKVFEDYGEEKFSKKIAFNVIKARQEKEIQTTTDLFEIIKKSLPAPLRFKAGDSARRIFQALRIEVNKELENLEKFLPAAFQALKPNGRMAVISFHSLEDRMVKNFFLDLAKGCLCPPEFPTCICGNEPKVKILTRKVLIAKEEEVRANSRAGSAKMRVIEKI